MMTAFDHIARQYDVEFSDTLIGQMQRNLVHRYVEKTCGTETPLKILELNCGTGEDAFRLARQGHIVLATDISGEMIEVARNKWMAAGGSERIGFKIMNLLQSAKELNGQKFDLVFSNFGGFNCIGRAQFKDWLHEQLPALLNPGGRFIAVIMPGFCAWETIYFLAKFRLRTAFRRSSKGPVQGKLNDTISVKTWYYSPAWIKRHLAAELMVTAVKPIGVFIPPSYLNGFFSTHKKLLNMLYNIEIGIGQLSAAAFLSDHYLVEIKRKPI